MEAEQVLEAEEGFNMRQGLITKDTQFVAYHMTPFRLPDGTVTTLNRTGQDDRESRSTLGDTKMAAKKAASKKSSVVGKKGAKASMPASLMSNIKKVASKGKKG